MKIPQYFAQELPKVPDISAQAAAMPYEARAQFGGVLADLGQRIYETEIKIREKQREERSRSDIAQGIVEIEMANADIVNELNKNPNPDTYFMDWNKAFNEAVNRKLETVKDPKTRAAMALEFKRIQIRELVKQKEYGNKLWINSERARREKILQGYISLGKYDEGLELIRASRDIYSDTELVNIEDNFKKDFEKSSLISKLESNSIALIEEGLRELEGTSLSRVEKASARINALNRIERLKKEEEAKAEKAAIDNALYKVKREWPNSPDMQITLLTSSEWQKENGLDTQMAQKAQERWKAEQALKKMIGAEEIARIQSEFISRVYDPKRPLTHSEVENSKLEPVGEGSKAFFHKLIEGRAKAILENKNLPYMVSNGKTLADMLTRHSNPNLPPLTATEILSYVGKEDGISVAHAEQLIKASDVTNTDIFKNTEAMLKSNFGYEGVLVGFGNKPLGAIYYNNAMTEILEEVAKKPLKGAALRNRMIEIATPHLMNYMKEIGESQEDVAKKLKLLGSPLSPSINLIPKEKEQKPPKGRAAKEEYEVNRIYMDAQGRKAKYLGDGKWQLVK